MMVKNQVRLINRRSFDDVLPAITKIREAFGAPSISLGVLHENQVVFTHAEGTADVEKNVTPDEHTVYCVASCSKAFIAAACGILVDEGKLSWTEPIQTYLPEFKTKHDPEIGRRANLMDFLSHGTGLAPLDHLASWLYDEYPLDKSDMVHVVSNSPTVYNFRSKFLYSNNVVGIVADVITAVTGKTPGTFIRERIFEPLGMSRSCTKSADFPQDGNVARGYQILDDGTPFPMKYSACEDGGPQGAAGFVQTSVHDMLLWARAVLDADSNDEHVHRGSNPLREIQLMRASHRPISTHGGGNANEKSYGMGWLRYMLPTDLLGCTGPNYNMSLFDAPPMINKDGPPRLVLAHYGEYNGYLTSFYTFPATKSAIIVVANCSPGRGDPTDLIAQTLIQRLFHMTPHVELEDYALQAAKTTGQMWSQLVEEFHVKRKANTRSDALSAYIGAFSSKDFRLTVNISELPSTEQDRSGEVDPYLLAFNINGYPRQSAKLFHYHEDVWSFLPRSRDDALKSGLENYLNYRILLLHFQRDKSGRICALEWDLQAGACEGPAPGIGDLVSRVRFERK